VAEGGGEILRGLVWSIPCRCLGVVSFLVHRQFCLLPAEMSPQADGSSRFCAAEHAVMVHKEIGNARYTWELVLSMATVSLETVGIVGGGVRGRVTGPMCNPSGDHNR